MAARIYSLLRGRVIDCRSEPIGKSPHFQILVDGDGTLFRVAVNTRSGTSRQRQAELLFLADDDFRHDIASRLEHVEDGLHRVQSSQGGLALDYQRGGMFDRRHMRRIPANLPGPNNDLADELEFRSSQAIASPGMRICAYGTRWGPEPNAPDQVFDFAPGNGIHDVHMNQGNRDEHAHDNGAWADGGLFYHDPEQGRWCAIFLAFQTQSWRTDNQGDPIGFAESSMDPRDAADLDGRPAARIRAAFVNPNEQKRGGESVVVWNETDQPLGVSGWRILNRERDETALTGEIPPRTGRRFSLPGAVALSNRGGLIRLIDEAGNEVDGVSYTRHEARRKRGKLTF